MARRSSGQRGAALLVVMVSVALLTALAVDLAYDARVSLQISANARDELAASYLAKGGVQLSRLVLSFQQQIDDAVPPLPTGGSPRPQLWRVIPVGSALVGGLFPPEADGGGARGTFEVRLDDEARKVNVQLEGSATGLLSPLSVQAQALFQLVCDPRWDPVFDREDSLRVRLTRQDLLVYLRDWVDGNEQTSALAAAFPAGTCLMLTPGNPFEDGFGDENQPYDRGEERYRPKNARMDSLDELYLVAGVDDAFMAAFGDALTVYLPREAKRNVNELDAERLVENAKLIADPPGQPALYDPEFSRRLQALVAEQTFGGMLSITPAEFGRLVESAGVTVNMGSLTQSSPTNPFTDRSSVFRVRSEGKVGAVAKTLDAVVRFDRNQQVQDPAPGRIVHWREE